FLGGRGPDLALSVLQLGQVVEGLPPAPSAASPVCLPAELPLGRALAALAGAGEDATVAVEGGPGGTYPARGLRERILADLKVAADANHRGGADPCLPPSSSTT